MNLEGSYPSKCCSIPPVEQKLCLMEPIRLKPPPGTCLRFQMIKTILVEATLALGGGSSAYSR